MKIAELTSKKLTSGAGLFVSSLLSLECFTVQEVSLFACVVCENEADFISLSARGGGDV